MGSKSVIDQNRSGNERAGHWRLMAGNQLGEVRLTLRMVDLQATGDKEWDSVTTESPEPFLSQLQNPSCSKATWGFYGNADFPHSSRGSLGLFLYHEFCDLRTALILSQQIKRTLQTVRYADMAHTCALGARAKTTLPRNILHTLLDFWHNLQRKLLT